MNQFNFKKFREVNKMTHEDVAEILRSRGVRGIDKYDVSSWETGTLPPCGMILRQLTRLYSCSIHDLLNRRLAPVELTRLYNRTTPDLLNHTKSTPTHQTKHTCPTCKNEEHPTDAKYCKICGQKVDK